MYFTSNHDENSWNKADYGSFPGPVHAPFAVLTHTMVRSIPLIYGGQEEPVLRAIKFFDKDTMSFGKFERASFYKTLLELRKRNAALSPDAFFQRFSAGNKESIYSFIREKDGKKILVIVNLSGKEQRLRILFEKALGEATNVFTKEKETIKEISKIEPWGYRVYEY
jgi:glycosidase